MSVVRLAVVLVLLVTAAASSVSAQRGGRGGGAPQAPPSPQASALIDMTGYWVAIVTEDWRWRMVTPQKGDFPSVPINPEARKIAESWDPSTDGSCLAYGAAALMRMPTRLNITWENENVLKIETDAGQQTRRFVFDKATPVPGQRSLQGFSVAEWERPAGGRAGGLVGLGGGAAPAAAPPAVAPAGAPLAGAARAGGPPAGGPGAVPAAGAPPAGARAGGPPAPRVGNLKVITTNLSGGWLRKNGVPYSEGATVTEYYDRIAVGNDVWLVATTIVSDPKYLTQDFVTSSHFRREADGAKKWDPTPCKAAP